MTKGGLAATKSLAIEYASRGIRVNAVSPGIIQTPVHPAESYAGLALGSLQRAVEEDSVENLTTSLAGSSGTTPNARQRWHRTSTTAILSLVGLGLLVLVVILVTLAGVGHGAAFSARTAYMAWRADLERGTGASSSLGGGPIFIAERAAQRWRSHQLRNGRSLFTRETHAYSPSPSPLIRLPACQLMPDQRGEPSDAYGGLMVTRGLPISVCRGEH